MLGQDGGRVAQVVVAVDRVPRLDPHAGNDDIAQRLTRSGAQFTRVTDQDGAEGYIRKYWQNGWLRLNCHFILEDIIDVANRGKRASHIVLQQRIMLVNFLQEPAVVGVFDERSLI